MLYCAGWMPYWDLNSWTYCIQPVQGLLKKKKKKRKKEEEITVFEKTIDKACSIKKEKKNRQRGGIHIHISDQKTIIEIRLYMFYKKFYSFFFLTA